MNQTDRRCIRCGGPLAANHPTQRCQPCSEKAAAYAQRYYRNRKKANRCWECANSLPKMQQPRVRCDSCAEAYSCRRRNRNQKIKKEVMNAYGGRCACCGETNLWFLTIDHINGGGTADTRGRGGDTFYRRLKAQGFPNDPPLQVLCWNCNLAKHHRGACPHQH